MFNESRYFSLSSSIDLVLKYVMKAVQKEREEKLARTLRDLLHQYVRGDKVGFVRHAESEAERLSHTGQLNSPLPILFSFSFIGKLFWYVFPGQSIFVF